MNGAPAVDVGLQTTEKCPGKIPIEFVSAERTEEKFRFPSAQAKACLYFIVLREMVMPSPCLGHARQWK